MRRARDDVGDAEIVQPPLAFLEEQDELVARAVVIAHADRALVPHQRLPELEAGPLGLRLGDEHRFGVAEQVEVLLRLSTRNTSANSSPNRAFGKMLNQSLLDARWGGGGPVDIFRADFRLRK